MAFPPGLPPFSCSPPGNSVPSTKEQPGRGGACVLTVTGHRPPGKPQCLSPPPGLHLHAHAWPRECWPPATHTSSLLQGIALGRWELAPFASEQESFPTESGRTGHPAPHLLVLPLPRFPHALSSCSLCIHHSCGDAHPSLRFWGARLQAGFERLLSLLLPFRLALPCAPQGHSLRRADRHPPYAGIRLKALSLPHITLYHRDVLFLPLFSLEAVFVRSI